MAADWSYAELCKEVKLAGGPDCYNNRLIESGIERGKKDGRIEILLIVSGIVSITFFAKKAYDKWFNKKITAIEEANMQSLNCINGDVENNQEKLKGENNNGTV